MHLSRIIALLLVLVHFIYIIICDSARRFKERLLGGWRRCSCCEEDGEISTARSLPLSLPSSSSSPFDPRPRPRLRPPYLFTCSSLPPPCILFLPLLSADIFMIDERACALSFIALLRAFAMRLRGDEGIHEEFEDADPANVNLCTESCVTFPSKMPPCYCETSLATVNAKPLSMQARSAAIVSCIFICLDTVSMDGRAQSKLDC